MSHPAGPTTTDAADGVIVVERGDRPTIAPEALVGLLADGGELAVLDVRDERDFADGHLLHAASVPLSTLELDLERLLPRHSVRVIVTDGGSGNRSERAIDVLRARGYDQVTPLAGNAHTWEAAGLGVFTGVHVRSKAVGETTWGIPSIPAIDALELDRRRESGEDLVVVDTRTVLEIEDQRIPGSIACPGPELVHRVRDLAPSPETLVVVTCAGRTRGLVGAHSLIDAGLPNPVAWLEDGTNGWRFAGLALEDGPIELPGPPSPDARAWAAAAAERVAATAGVETADASTVARLRAERQRRTLYLFDVRTREEYEGGHVADSHWVAGGQLAQELDAHVAVRGARIVLIDDPDATRSRFTALWLRRQGAGDVYVAPDLLATEPLISGDEPTEPIPAPEGVLTTDLQALRDGLDAGETVMVDVADSRTYAAGHIPEAWFAIRARLTEERPVLPEAVRYVITSPTGELAGLAVGELQELTSAPVLALKGGTAAWAAAGLPIETGIGRRLTEPDDLWGPDVNDEEQFRAFFAEYRVWCEQVAGQIERTGGWE